MSFSSLVRPLVLAILAATPLLTAPNAARAQGLIDFLWGGTDEWGGKRQVVDFGRSTPLNCRLSQFHAFGASRR